MYNDFRGGKLLNCIGWIAFHFLHKNNDIFKLDEIRLYDNLIVSLCAYRVEFTVILCRNTQ
jgi:hypothetical protein